MRFIVGRSEALRLLALVDAAYGEAEACDADALAVLGIRLEKAIDH
ncbi:MAG: hypothetical protein GY723_12815 [bacterium]|nr:hypothetical protein [bacterium]MCP5066340.1 hypothetical protein [bacterium]